MSDIFKTVAQSFGVLGLKPRSAQACVDYIKSKGFEVSDADGFLQVTQGDQQMNVSQILQATFKQQPAMFYGHSGEVRYKSDVLDNAAKVKFIADHGYQSWANLPVNENSPSAKHVVKPTIVSTELTRREWLTLTPAEKSEAISGWGKDGLANVSAIFARTK